VLTVFLGGVLFSIVIVLILVVWSIRRHRDPDLHIECDTSIDELIPTLAGLTLGTAVAGNLPAKGNVNALREGHENQNLLFAGTEFGLFVTLDGGDRLLVRRALVLGPLRAVPVVEGDPSSGCSRSARSST